MEKVYLTVSNLTAHSEKEFKKFIDSVYGIEDVSVDLEKNRVIVDFKPPASVDSIIVILNNLGYEVVL